MRCLKRVNPAICIAFLFVCLFPAVGSAQFLPWEYHNILTDTKESGNNPDFIVDGAGNFHLTYWNIHEDRLIYGYSSDNGATFSFEVSDSIRQQGFKSKLAVDSGNQPHIVYYENGGGKANVVYA